MLVVQRNAFKNCKSLKEIHCEAFDDIQSFKSKNNDNLCVGCKIIVKDKLFEKWLFKNFETNLVKASKHIKDMLDATHKNNILEAICLMHNAEEQIKHICQYKELQLFIENLRNMLKTKYNIDQDSIDQFCFLLKRKEKYESE